MVRRVLLGAALLLAGCASDGALDIVVPATAGVAKVRLYVGLGDGATNAIAPAGYDSYLSPNQWWSLDPAAALDVREVGDGSEVVFELARGANGESKLAVAVVIGFDDTGKIVGGAELHDVEIPTDYIARHIVPLDTTALATTWPAGEDTCVAIYNADLARAEMVVDPSDPDCDGFTSDADECDPYFYKSQGTVRLEDTTCVVQSVVTETGGSTVATCVLGGPTCVDGGGTGGTCAPSGYCVPQSDCATCNYQLSCLYDARASAFAGPHFQCNIGTDDVGNLCVQDFVVGLKGMWPELPTCNTDALITRDGNYAGEVKFPTASGEVRISLQNPMSDCTLAIRAEGPLPSGESVAGFIAGSFDNGRGWGLPVIVTAGSGGCDDPNAGCHLEAASVDDQFVACVTGTPP